MHSVIEAPFGAHPTSHVPSYAMDAWVLMEYAGEAAGENFSAYVDRIRTESEKEYRDRLIGSRGPVLKALVDAAETLEGEHA